jgi:hypothetical protein
MRNIHAFELILLGWQETVRNILQSPTKLTTVSVLPYRIDWSKAATRETWNLDCTEHVPALKTQVACSSKTLMPVYKITVRHTYHKNVNWWTSLCVPLQERMYVSVLYCVMVDALWQSQPLAKQFRCVVKEFTDADRQLEKSSSHNTFIKSYW